MKITRGLCLSSIIAAVLWTMKRSDIPEHGYLGRTLNVFGVF